MRSKTKKCVSGMMSAVMVLGMAVPCTGMNVLAEDAAAKTIELGAAGIANPTVPEAGAESWIGDYVYYGDYENNADKPHPIKFRVLDPETTDFGGRTMLLDGDEAWKHMGFYESGEGNAWVGSDAEIWLNGEFLNNSFTDAERNVIAESVKAEGEVASGKYGVKLTQPALTGQKAFCLSVSEAMNPEYGFENNEGKKTGTRTKYDVKKKKNNAWWLRGEEVGYTFMVAQVDWLGYVTRYRSDGNKIGGPYNQYTVVPAMNLNLDDIVFTSPAAMEKADTLAAPQEYTEGEWKLTVKDGNDFSEGTSLNGSNVVKAGEI